MPGHRYSDAQRQVIAACFLMISERIRGVEDIDGFNRDTFLLLNRVYLDYFSRSYHNVNDLSDVINKDWQTTKDKLDALAAQNLIEFADDPDDARAWVIKGLPGLSVAFSPFLDTLIDLVRMTIECIKDKRRMPPLTEGERAVFSQKLSEISSISATQTRET